MWKVIMGSLIPHLLQAGQTRNQCNIGFSVVLHLLALIHNMAYTFHLEVFYMESLAITTNHLEVRCLIFAKSIVLLQNCIFLYLFRGQPFIFAVPLSISLSPAVLDRALEMNFNMMSEGSSVWNFKSFNTCNLCKAVYFL